MPKFKIKEGEKKTVKTVTFTKESDYQTVKLDKKFGGKICLLHNVQAEKLIKEGKATSVKAETVEATETRASKTIEKKNK